MPLRPAQQFQLALASIAVAVAAETGLLWHLSQKPAPAASPRSDVSAPNALTPRPQPTAPLFTVPDLPDSPETARPSSSPRLSASGAAKPLVGPKREQAKRLFEAATAALDRKDLRTALEDFRKVVQIAPDHLPTRLNLALLYLNLNQPAQAIPHLQKAAQLDPKSAAPRFELARTFLRLRRPAEAIVPLQEVVRLAPREREARVLLAQVYGAQKRPREAYAQWCAMALNDPRDVEAHLAAAQFASQVLNRPTEAEKWLRLAQKGAPRDPQAPLVLGRVLLSQRRAKEAAQVLSQAARARPDVFELLPPLADARLATGDLKGAQNAVQSALLRLPVGKTDAQKAQIAGIEGTLQLTLGRIWGGQKKPAQARRAFERAAALLPRAAEPRSLLAVAALQSGDSPAAIAALQEAIALDPKRADDHLALAQVEARAKNWSVARQQYAAYAQLQPRDAQALLEWAQVASVSRQSGEELQILARLAAIQPKNPAPFLQRGALQRSLGRPREALRSFEAALALRGDDPNLLFEVARLQTSLQQPDRAAATWKKVIAARPDFVPAYTSLLASSQRSGQGSGARLFLARQLSRGRENPIVLSEILRFYSTSGQNSQAQALLSDVLQRNPRAKLARAALASFSNDATPVASETPRAEPAAAPSATPVS